MIHALGGLPAEAGPRAFLHDEDAVPRHRKRGGEERERDRPVGVALPLRNLLGNRAVNVVGVASPGTANVGSPSWLIAESVALGRHFARLEAALQSPPTPPSGEAHQCPARRVMAMKTAITRKNFTRPAEGPCAVLQSAIPSAKQAASPIAYATSRFQRGPLTYVSSTPNRMARSWRSASFCAMIPPTTPVGRYCSRW
jgi:hypothetical protein